MVISVETVNYIALLTNTSHLDIVMNFMALVVIADFDDFFYGALADGEYKKVITNSDGTYDEFLSLQMTTSFLARNPTKKNYIERQEVEKIEKIGFPEEDLDAENPRDTAEYEVDGIKRQHRYHDYIPKYIYQSFWNRRWDNKLLYGIYWLFRTTVVSFWYYLVPFVALMASFLVPFLNKRAEAEQEKAELTAAPLILWGSYGGQNI